MPLYANDGSINVTVVTGTVPTGLYAPDGSLNVILSDPSVNKGLYHACGAIYVTVAYEGGPRSPLPAYAPNGSRYVSLAPFTNLEGAMRITVVNGTFAKMPVSGTAPTLYLDFINNFGYANGTYAPVSNFLTFSRASPAYYFDKDGNFKSVGNDVPRFTYDPTTKIPRGLLIEQGRTNFNRNSTAAGCAVGTPGTPPNFMSFNSVVNGLARSIVDTGILDNGMTYFDFRLTGNSLATNISSILFLDSWTAPGAEVLLNDVQTSSCYFALVGGSLNGITTLEWRQRYFLIDGTTTSVLYPVSMLSTLDSKLKRYEVSGAAVADGYAVSTMVVGTTAGTFYDFTIRMACPQREQGSYATSFIPTSIGPVIRSADIARISDSYVNYAIDSTNNKGTWLYIGEAFNPSQVNLRQISTCNTAVPSFSESYGTTLSSGIISYTRSANAYTFLTGAAAVNTPIAVTKHAFSFAPNNYWHSTNGNAPVVQASGAGPLTLQDRIFLGTTAHSPGGSNSMCAAIRSLTFWTTNLPSTDATGLTV